MNPEIRKIVEQIHALERQLEQRFHAAQGEFYDSLEDGRARFTQEMRSLHKRYRVGVIRYVFGARLTTVLTAPVIYGMALPLAILDLGMTLYQHICFRAYGVPRVKRGDYIVIDRHRLAYLNLVQKMNCAYCGYGNGLIAYTREIISRTEQYWCPIRHAGKMLGVHERYNGFLAFGDAEAYHGSLGEKRSDLKDPQ